MKYVDAIHPNFGLCTIQNDIIVTPFWTSEFCEYLLGVVAANKNQFLEMNDYDGQTFRYLDFYRFDEQLSVDAVHFHQNEVVRLLCRYWDFYFRNNVKVYSPHILEYGNGGPIESYKHTDIGIFSTNIKLNSDYEGCNVTFPRQKFSLCDVPVGHAVFWPSALTHPHYVPELISGKKYSVCIFTGSYATPDTKGCYDK